MICKDCAKAADHGAPRESHCDDEKCPCQHRPTTLRCVPKRRRAGAVAVDVEPVGGVL